MKGCIYQISNSATGDRYIGSSTNAEGRFVNHIKSLRSGGHCNSFLQSSFNKYGESCFSMEILECVDVSSRSDLYDLEDLLIAEMSPEFNICQKSGRPPGGAMKPETRFKLRDAMSGRKFTQEHRDKLSVAHIGNTSAKGNRGGKLSAETRRKMSESHSGKQRSRSHCESLSASLTDFFNISKRLGILPPYTRKQVDAAIAEIEYT